LTLVVALAGAAGAGGLLYWGLNAANEQGRRRAWQERPRPTA
jgi:hypothetical protein